MRNLKVLILTLFICCTISKAWASSIAQISFADLSNNSELIFRGTVISHQNVVKGDAEPRTIVRFSLKEIIKGQHNSTYLNLSFLGGYSFGEMLVVTGMRIPPIGEEGVYFVESTTSNQANPLLGWHQGHYVIVNDSLSKSALVFSTFSENSAVSPTAGKNEFTTKSAISFEKFRTRILDNLEK